MNFKIGFYGNDAQTEFVLVDAAGKICAHTTTIGCNPNLFLDQDTIRSVIIEALTGLVSAGNAQYPDGRLTHTVLCMPGSQSFWRGIVARLTDFGTVSTLAWYVPTLELATSGGAGLVLDGGTLRSFVAARGQDGSLHSAGNFGWRVSDAGSHYDLGRRALVRALLELQGWAAPSAVGSAAGVAIKTTDADVLPILLDAPPTSPLLVANLGKQVLTLATSGDSAAAAIVRESVQELGRLAGVVREKLFADAKGPGAPVVAGLSGQLLQTETAREALRLVLGEGVRFVPIVETPVEGLRRFLARLN